MKHAIRRTSSAIVALGAVGVSSLFLGVAPASAATEACGATGTLIGPGLCEATFTTGTQVFTPTASMTKLEVLLVGAGGSGANQATPNTNGYAAGGGGGQVKIVDFSGSTAPLTLTVATPGVPATITDGTRTETAINGSSALDSSGTGGASGGGFAGAPGGTNGPTLYGAGGGAAASPTTAAPQNGGAGVTVSAIAPAGSLFAGDANCYGGGGATGTTTVQGVPGCGAGGPADATATVAAPPAANRGGGGAGLNTTQSAAARGGAAGVTVVRFTAANVSLAFAANGHGAAPATQTIPAGASATRPADPTAAGFAFGGWYTDAQLTTLADFAAPITGSVTYYARWTPTLAVTGANLNPAAVPIGLAALIAGAGLVVFAKRRRSAN